MAITRRQFLKRSGMAVAGSMFVPSLFDNPFLRHAFASTIGDRYFVVIYLDGGNDGLNTVVPVTNGSGTLRSDYEAARNNLNLTPAQLAETLIGVDPNTGAQLALHPGLAGTGAGLGGLKALYDAGKVAVIQGCGYPNYSLSHADARAIWQTANPLGVNGYGTTGWMGRFLADASQEYVGPDVPAVTINDSVTGEYKQNQTSVLALRRLRDYRFPYDAVYVDDVTAKRDALDALYQAAASTVQPASSYIGHTGVATLLSGESYPFLHSLYETDRGSQSVLYDDVHASIGRDLREVAKIIYGVATGQPNVQARFFQASIGSFDHHADQGGATGIHHELLKKVGDSVRVFFEDLTSMPGNVADKTTVLVWSEFGRRIAENGNGTDHGSQGPTFVIGGTVNGGVYGHHPNITASARDTEGNSIYTQSADPFRSTDIRDVYGTILKHWLNMPMAAVSAVLSSDTGDPADFWTSPNFDMGFLS